MIKSLKTFMAIAALVGVSVIASSVSAEAGDNRYRKSANVAKVSTSYQQGRTTREVRNVTRYRDIERPRTVTHTRRVVNVTRIQPVTRINTVTRVHNRTAVIRENRYATQTNVLPTRHVRTGKTVISRTDARPTSNTVYRYKTVRQVNNVTRYRDVNNTRYVRHVNRVVRVNNVQPVVRTNVVTRIHERPQYVTRNQYVDRVEYLPERTVRSGKTVQINHGTTYREGGHSRYKKW